MSWSWENKRAPKDFVFVIVVYMRDLQEHLLDEARWGRAAVKETFANRVKRKQLVACNRSSSFLEPRVACQLCLASNWFRVCFRPHVVT